MKKAVVVGGGVVGLCSADSLQRRGFAVAVLDRDPEPGDGCSYGNGGLVVPSHFEPLASPGLLKAGLKMMSKPGSPFGFRGLASLEVAGWVARFLRAATEDHVHRCAPLLRDLNLASRSLYEERFDGLAFGYCRSGELMICQTQAAFAGEQALAEEANRLGLATQVLSRSELAKFETGIEVEAEGAVYFQDDARLSPSLFLNSLKASLSSRGVEFQYGKEVQGFRLEGGRVKAALMPGGEVEGDEFVLSSGAHTGRLARKLGLALPLLAGQGYGFTLAQPPARPLYPAILIEGRVAVTPMPEGVRFVGTMELGPPSDFSANPLKVEGMKKAITSFYPQLQPQDMEGVPLWKGQRPCTPDGMPYLGRTAAARGVILATGHGMMGMSLGPITGELVGQIASGQTPSLPLSLLDPDRYA